MNIDYAYVDWGDLAETFTTTSTYICPDLLEYDDIGAADNLRGRFVRAVFWALRIWPA